MVTQDDDAVLAVLDSEGWQLAGEVGSDTALTLLAVASEDPSDFAELLACWPRYRNPMVCEFASQIPFAKSDPKEVLEAIRGSKAWVVIDCVEKRVLTGGTFQAIERDAVYDMNDEEAGKSPFPLSVHLAPWWELHQHVEAERIERGRETLLEIPRVDRDVLFGLPMVQDLAGRILNAVQSEAWVKSQAASHFRSRHGFTIIVHRDWLMTPRDDLQGLYPRQMLHRGRPWINSLIWGQQLRLFDGAEVVAIPQDLAAVQTAPMSTEELVVYYDLCRVIIAAGWEWCRQHPEEILAGNQLETSQLLVTELTRVRDEWLAGSMEGEAPVRFTLECSRRRVPQALGVSIVGIEGIQEESHILDCDCPICLMMADGMMGPEVKGMQGLDGYVLEEDEEFAFSIYETREEWARENGDFLSESEEGNDFSESDSDGEETSEFASAWSGVLSDQPIPGDIQGHWQLAFLLAEIVSDLQVWQAPADHIQSLNQAFIDYRRSYHDEMAESAERLKKQLEDLAQTYPDLVSKSADFASRVDEQLRTPI